MVAFLKSRKFFGILALLFASISLFTCSGGARKYIAVNGLKLDMTKGYYDVRKTDDPLVIKATITPSIATNKNLKWSTANTSIINIEESSGKIYPLKEGRAIVRCQSVDNPKIYQECDLEIITPIDTEGLTVNKSSLKLEIDAEEKLDITFTPATPTYTSLTWSSNDPSIATVDSTGKVKGVGYGSTYVVAKAFDNQWIRVPVSVYNPTPSLPLEEFRIKNPKETTTFVYGQLVDLDPVFVPSNVNNKNVRWESSDTELATVDSAGRVYFVPNGLGKQGDVTITCTPISDEDMAAQIVLRANEPAALLFTSDSSFTISTANKKKNWNGTLYYSREYYDDNTLWSVWDGTGEIASGKEEGEEKQRLYIRGKGNTYITNQADGSFGKRWVVDCKNDLVGIFGGISRLMTYDNPPWSIVEKGFSGWMRDANRIWHAPRIDINGHHYGFDRMFSGCSNLKVGPLWDRINDVGDYGAFAMIEGCHKLEAISFMSWSDSSDNAYHSMFYYDDSMMVSNTQTTTCPNYFWNAERSYLYIYYGLSQKPNDKNSTGAQYTNLKVLKTHPSAALYTKYRQN